MPENERSKRSHFRRRQSVLKANKFYATTNLLGFNLIYKSSTKYESAFWYVIIISFFIVTIYNVVDLAQQFASQATVTHVSIQKLGTEYELPLFRLSLKMILPELNPEFQNSSHVFKVATGYSRPLAEEVREALRKLKTKEKMLNSKWDYILLPLLTRYHIYMSTCEINNEQCVKQNYELLAAKGRFMWFFETFLVPEMAPVREAMFMVQNHSISLNISPQELKEAYTRQLLEWMDFRLYDPYISHKEATFLWKRPPWSVYLSHISHMAGTLTFVFELQRDGPVPVGHWGSKHGVWFRANFATMRDMLVNNSATNVDEDELRKWYLGYGPEIKITFGEESAAPEAVSTDAELRTWILRISSSFRAIKDCSSPAGDGSVFCTQYCMRDQLADVCGCEPIFIRTRFPQNASCSPADYLLCMENHQEDNFRNNCSYTCPLDCILDLYELRIAYGVPTNRWSMGIGFYLIPSERPVFQEHYSQSWQSFLAELGGTFDFWLGASVVGWIHIIVYLLKQIVYAVKKEKSFAGTVLRAMSMKRPKQTDTDEDGSAISMLQLPDSAMNIEDINKALIDLRYRIAQLERTGYRGRKRLRNAQSQDALMATPMSVRFADVDYDNPKFKNSTENGPHKNST